MKLNFVHKFGLAILMGVSVSCSNQSTQTPNAAEGASSQQKEAIRLNQLGFYPKAPKKAVVAGNPTADAFYVLSQDKKDTLFSGVLSEQRTSPYSGKNTRIADFSTFEQEGTFLIAVEGAGFSHPVVIGPEIHAELTKAAIKGFYFQRASTALPAEYAGKWARPAGHPDTMVQIHASAASPKRPEGTFISAPLGWYDAGDYNKYIVNSGISMGTMLSLFEDFPAYVKELEVAIPERENELPDLLDELLWNLRWMRAMQDPEDGGVYHKLTTPGFEGMIMPEEAQKQRYVVQKGTAASLDYAAVMAQASRVLSQYEDQLPGLSADYLESAEKAWKWAQKNPEQIYDQGEMNKKFKPAVTTGAYGDQDVNDEWIWAASELFITTGKRSYLDSVNLFPNEDTPLPSWSQVRLLGYYSLLRHQDKLAGITQPELGELENRIIKFADALISTVDRNAYATVMGGSERDFIWGSSAVAANQGIALIQAYKLTGDKKYLRNALSNLDYLLGRNATAYSFVTGYGQKTPMYPHHRPSVADGLEEPVPGLLAGGPNPGQQDKCSGYLSSAADESYADVVCSYASNEIAINWNAPLVYLAGAIEALQQDLALQQEEL